MPPDTWFLIGLALAAFLLVVLVFSLIQLRLHAAARPAPSPEPEPAQGLLPRAEITLRMLRAFQARNTAPHLHAQLFDDEAFLIIRPDEEPLVVPAAPLYAAYAEHPEQLEQLLAGSVDSLLASLLSPDPTTLPLEQARWMIMPRVRQQRSGEPDPLAVPLGHDLEIGLVVESPHRVATLAPDTLQRWDLSPEEARELALTNLELRTSHIPILRERLDDDDAIYMFEARDGYDATRILLTELWRELDRELAGRLYIAIPNRDLLIAFTDRDLEAFDQLQRRVLERFERERHPLTWRLFSVTPEGVQPHTPSLH